MSTKDNLSLIIGRFNPLTVYHRDIIEQMEGQVIIATTTSHNEQNPIPPKLKAQMLEQTFPDAIVISCKSALDALISVGNMFESPTVTVHCGNDRSDSYSRLNNYTNETGVEIASVVTHKRLNKLCSASHSRYLATNGMWRHFQAVSGYYDQSLVHLAYETIQVNLNIERTQGKANSQSVKHHD